MVGPPLRWLLWLISYVIYMDRCIVCWLNFLNGKRGNKGIVDCYSMKLCPNCRKVSKTSRFTMADALADPKNRVHCGTATLKPAFQKYPPHIIWDVYKKIITIGLQNRRKPSYIEAYAEYTAANCLHMHFYAVGDANALGTIYAGFRRLGWVLLKQCFDSEKWLDYCRKDQTVDSLPVIRCSS